MSNGTPQLSPPRLPSVAEVFADERLRRVAAAAEAGDAAQVKAQMKAQGLSPSDLDAVQPAGVNLLMYEISVRNETAVRTLLDAGADPNVMTPEGLSPMLIAGAADDPRYLGLLLDKGGDPNLKTPPGEPLLVQLVPYGRWDNMIALLDHGADIDKAGPSGQTAAFRLGALHQFDRVHALLERGADPALADEHGLRLASFVVQKTPPDSPQEEWRRRVAQRIGVTLP
jgi:ankyrin repeat protein